MIIHLIAKNEKPQNKLRRMIGAFKKTGVETFSYGNINIFLWQGSKPKNLKKWGMKIGNY